MKYKIIAAIVLVIGIVAAVLNSQSADSTPETPPPSTVSESDAAGMFSALQSAKKLHEQKNTLNMKGKDLPALPSEVLDKTFLVNLDLSYNQITSLPAEIGRLTLLQSLNIEHNALTGALPAEIRTMSNLSILDASDNHLTGIPAEIGQLHELAMIDLSNNELDTMPNEIEQLAETLEVFNLSGNNYSSDQIAEIQAKLPHTNVIF